jgi:hypothetical protein
MNENTVATEPSLKTLKSKLSLKSELSLQKYGYGKLSS